MILKEKVAIVTGGGSGIGEGIALRFAREGARLVIPDINLEGAEKTRASIEALGQEALSIQADVSNSEEIDRVVKEALERFGRIDILVNNAGIRYSTPFLELSEEDWNRSIAVNLNGVFLFMQRVAREMIRLRTGGRIVNIASVSGFVAVSNRASYCATKAAVIQLTRVAALELAKDDIRVNVIAPGIIETPLTQRYKAALDQDSIMMRSILATVPLGGRMGSPNDVAEAALYLASEASCYVTGSTIVVDAGFSLTSGARARE